jgi:hypothetical protein
MAAYVIALLEGVGTWLDHGGHTKGVSVAVAFAVVVLLATSFTLMSMMTVTA